MMIIQVSAPTTNAEEEDDKFYSQVQSEIDRTCKKHVLFVPRD